MSSILRPVRDGPRRRQFPDLQIRRNDCARLSITVRDHGVFAAGALATALRTPAAPGRREHDHPKQEGQALSQCPANCRGGKPVPRQYSYEAEHESGVRPVHEDIRCDPVARDEQRVNEVRSPCEKRA